MNRNLKKFIFLTLGMLMIGASVQGRDRSNGNGTIQVDEVVSGSAGFDFSDNLTTIRPTNNAIINYHRFDVPSESVVQFIQPSASSRVLNRINSVAPSFINGTLEANGIVYFVNPAGITFGENSVIDAGRFLAAAGFISNEDFLSQHDEFITSDGSINNLGTLRGSEGIHLIGKEIFNYGSIVSEKGLVTLTSGENVYLAENGNSLMVRADNLNAATGVSGNNSTNSSEHTDAEGVVNEGVVEADEIIFSSGDVFSLALINRGTLKSSGGKVTLSGNGLVANEGRIDVSNASGGGQGGNVELLGDRVSVTGTIDASGAADGGEVVIGGAKGEDNFLRKASGTFIGSEAEIHADGIGEGDGGRITVWSEESTRFYGTITARGGSRGGNGGFVETSGKNYLQVSGNVDASASSDNGGLWLLDPSNVTIQNGAGLLDGLTPNFTADQDGSTVDAAAINTALDAGVGVLISTDWAAGTEAGDIVQNADAPINKTGGGGATLTLRAANDIELNAGITSTSGVLNVQLIANDGAQSGHDLDTNAGDVDINAAIDTNGGTFSSSGDGFDNTGGSVATGGGNLTINHQDAVTVGAALNSGVGAVDIDTTDA
ncbi:MAG: filamentous hemagglutinin N-terminal domain-containing protein, partial [Sedimentisphaerales bacterium]|nr:filamentous hemagglutinin N-terminal domain-containing protein [Sedimentisphaerales bacterium]